MATSKTFIKNGKKHELIGVILDPVTNSNIIQIKISEIANYTRRQTPPYFGERSIIGVVGVNVSTPSIKNLPKDDANKYMIENWVEFLEFAQARGHKEYLTYSEIGVQSTAPKWDEIKSAKLAIANDENADINIVSAYS